MKLLTIVVPAYNMEQYIDQCLSSMADARFEGTLEVIVVDDGSTDGTARLAQTYVEAYPAIFRSISQENGGHGAAINTGVAHASGKYLRVVDADDWIDTGNLSLFLERLSRIDTDMVVDQRIIVDEGAGERKECAFPGRVRFDEAMLFSSGASEALLPFLNMHTLTVRVELLRRCGELLLSHTFYVDFQFAFFVFTQAHDMTLFDLFIYFYRMGNTGQSVYYLNYVKRYNDHDRVLKACLELHPYRIPAPGREELLIRSLVLLVHTQYKIALIYNPNREEGRRQARSLAWFLKKNHPQIAKGARKRYFTLLLLNILRVDYEKLKRLEGRGV